MLPNIPSLQGVIIALKKNDLMKFQVVTSPVPAPVGTELYKMQQATGYEGKWSIINN